MEASMLGASASTQRVPNTNANVNANANGVDVSQLTLTNLAASTGLTSQVTNHGSRIRSADPGMSAVANKVGGGAISNVNTMSNNNAAPSLNRQEAGLLALQGQHQYQHQQHHSHPQSTMDTATIGFYQALPPQQSQSHHHHHHHQQQQQQQQQQQHYHHHYKDNGGTSSNDHKGNVNTNMLHTNNSFMEGGGGGGGGITNHPNTHSKSQHPQRPKMDIAHVKRESLDLAGRPAGFPGRIDLSQASPAFNPQVLFQQVLGQGQTFVPHSTPTSLLRQGALTYQQQQSPRAPATAAAAATPTAAYDDDDDDEEEVFLEAGKKRTLKLREIATTFSLPITDAAVHLGICVTMLKKHCRKWGIIRWPHRRFKSLDHLRDKIIAERETSSHTAYFDNQLALLEKRRGALLEECMVSMRRSLGKRDLGSSRKFSSKARGRDHTPLGAEAAVLASASVSQLDNQAAKDVPSPALDSSGTMNRTIASSENKVMHPSGGGGVFSTASGKGKKKVAAASLATGSSTGNVIQTNPLEGPNHSSMPPLFPAPSTLATTSRAGLGFGPGLGSGSGPAASGNNGNDEQLNRMDFVQNQMPPYDDNSDQFKAMMDDDENMMSLDYTDDLSSIHTAPTSDHPFALYTSPFVNSGTRSTYSSPEMVHTSRMYWMIGSNTPNGSRTPQFRGANQGPPQGANSSGGGTGLGMGNGVQAFFGFPENASSSVLMTSPIMAAASASSPVYPPIGNVVTPVATYGVFRDFIQRSSPPLTVYQNNNSNSVNNHHHHRRHHHHSHPAEGSLRQYPTPTLSALVAGLGSGTNNNNNNNSMATGGNANGNQSGGGMFFDQHLISTPTLHEETSHLPLRSRELSLGSGNNINGSSSEGKKSGSLPSSLPTMATLGALEADSINNSNLLNNSGNGASPAEDQMSGKGQKRTFDTMDASDSPLNKTPETKEDEKSLVERPAKVRDSAGITSVVVEAQGVSTSDVKRTSEFAAEQMEHAVSKNTPASNADASEQAYAVVSKPNDVGMGSSAVESDQLNTTAMPSVATPVQPTSLRSSKADDRAFNKSTQMGRKAAAAQRASNESFVTRPSRLASPDLVNGGPMAVTSANTAAAAATTTFTMRAAVVKPSPSDSSAGDGRGSIVGQPCSATPQKEFTNGEVVQPQIHSPCATLKPLAALEAKEEDPGMSQPVHHVAGISISTTGSHQHSASTSSQVAKQEAKHHHSTHNHDTVTHKAVLDSSDRIPAEQDAAEVLADKGTEKVEKTNALTVTEPVVEKGAVVVEVDGHVKLASSIKEEVVKIGGGAESSIKPVHSSESSRVEGRGSGSANAINSDSNIRPHLANETRAEKISGIELRMRLDRGQQQPPKISVQVLGHHHQHKQEKPHHDPHRSQNHNNNSPNGNSNSPRLSTELPIEAPSSDPDSGGSHARSGEAFGGSGEGSGSGGSGIGTRSGGSGNSGWNNQGSGGETNKFMDDDQNAPSPPSGIGARCGFRGDNISSKLNHTQISSMCSALNVLLFSTDIFLNVTSCTGLSLPALHGTIPSVGDSLLECDKSRKAQLLELIGRGGSSSEKPSGSAEGKGGTDVLGSSAGTTSGAEKVSQGGSGQGASGSGSGTGKSDNGDSCTVSILQPYLDARSGLNVEHMYRHGDKKYVQLVRPLRSKRGDLIGTSNLCLDITSFDNASHMFSMGETIKTQSA